MHLMSMLRDALVPARVITDGEAAGLKLWARHADPNFARGTYERPLQAVIAETLSVGEVFYDIGANIGFFSLIAARRVGPAGRVYAFEPVPDNAAAIAASARLNGFDMIEVFPHAVGTADGPAELKLAHHIGGAMLASVGAPPDPRGTIEVDVVTIDAVVAARGLRAPSLIKIDVEGAELDVLNGLRKTLAAHRPSIIYEIDDASREGFERKAAALAAFMAAAGYALFALPAAYPAGDWHVGHVLAKPL